MQIKIVNIPLSDDGSMQAELNKFLATNRVLEVEQRFFQNEKGGCWSFCVRYISQFQGSNHTGGTRCRTGLRDIYRRGVGRHCPAARD
jgi:hypothetical protein